jgi:hypothetical protein
MSKNESTTRQFKKKASRIKHQTCYTCHNKGHLSKNCPKTQSFIHKIVNDNIIHLGPKIDTSTIKVVSSPCDSHHGIWVPKHLLTNPEGPTRLGYQNFLDQVIGRLRCIESLTIKQKRWNHYYIIKRTNIYANLTQCNFKDNISDYPYTWTHLWLFISFSCKSKKPYSNSLKVHFLLPYDTLNGSFMEQCILSW